MKKFRIFTLAIIIISSLIIFGIIRELMTDPSELIKEPEIVIMDNPELTKKETGNENTTPVIQKEPEIIPDKHTNFMLFTSQAPYAKWDDLHDEACEEASLIMAHNYLTESGEISLRYAEDEIQSMVRFQENLFGSHKDLNAEEMIKLAEDFYSEKFKIIDFENENFNGNFLKQTGYLEKQLSKGNIFILPVAGRELKNPYFRQPGPLYHALVLIGYDKEKQEFITHDPGTRRGENFRYSYEILLNAIHDFSGKKDDILEGSKKIIFIEK